MSLAAPTIADSAFWQNQAQRFVAFREDAIQRSERPLDASYHPEGWGLEHFRAFQDRSAGRWLLDGSTTASVEDFKDIAGVCAVALGVPNTDLAWMEWLEYLRRDSTNFNTSDFQMETWPREWRPEPDFEAIVSGLVSEPLEFRPESDAEIVSSDVREIEDVCGASERMCRRLASEVLKLELSLRAAADRTAQVPPSAQTPSATSSPAHDVSKTMTLKEAANALRVSVDTLERMRGRHEVEMFKVGSRWRVLASEVIRLRKQRRLDNR